MIVTFIDTETTDLHDTKIGYSAATQPYLMQVGLAARQYRKEGHRVIARMSALTEAPAHAAPGAFRAHGIRDTDGCFVPMVFMGMLDSVLAATDLLVGYNLPYDVEVIKTAFHRESISHFFLDRVAKLDLLPLASRACSLPATPAMVATGRGHLNKAPKLTEALDILCGKKPTKAHDALHDVGSTMRVHDRLVELGYVQDPMK